MNTADKIVFSTSLLLIAAPTFAEEVDLPAPVLEWSFYVLLIFAFFVAVGIFFSRGRNGKAEMVGGLLDETGAKVTYLTTQGTQMSGESTDERGSLAGVRNWTNSGPSGVVLSHESLLLLF